MGQITMSTRTVTVYQVGGYETTDYDKASRMLELLDADKVAAECADCKAVIPVRLVDRWEGNRCPAAKGTYQGHRVSKEDYERYEASKKHRVSVRK